MQEVKSAVPGADRVPEHFGNPFHEQATLAAGRAYTDLSFAEVVEVGGSDRLSWLHNLTSSDFLSLQPGESLETLVLDPNGHIEWMAGAVDDGERTYLITDQGFGDSLADFLNSMKFMLRVDVQRPEFATFGIMGAAGTLAAKIASLPASVLERISLTWIDPWPKVGEAGAHYGVTAGHPAASTERALLLAKPAAKLGASLEDAGFTPAGLLAWEAMRVAAWRPRPATEIVDRALPHELDLLRTAVHLYKGCYRGQETVAKLVNLGRPPRRLTYLYLEGPDGELPEPGAEVKLGERVVGQLTSVASHFEDGPVALALLKRNTSAEAELQIGPFVASQVQIVNREGKSSASPAQRPGAELRGSARKGLL